MAFNVAANLLVPQWGQTAGQNIRANMREARAEEQRNMLAQALPAALGGDQNALATVAQADPNAYLTLQKSLYQREQTATKASQEAEEKRAGEYAQDLTGTLASVYSTPAEQRAAAWQQGLARLGTKYTPEELDDLTPEWSDQLGSELAAGLSLHSKESADVLSRFGAIPAEQRTGGLAQKMAELQGAGIDPNSPEGKKYLGTYIEPDRPNNYAPQFQLVNDPALGAVLVDMRNPGVPARPVTGPDGQPVRNATYDPTLQGTIATSKASGTAQGKAQGEATAELPAAIQSGEYAMSVIDKLINSPGRSVITGKSGAFGLAASIPGSESANAKALLDQIGGQAFLEAFESLKGGGQITEVEGQKATQAKARLSTAQSDEEFLAALNELRGVIELGLQRARQKAQGAGPSQVAPAAAAPESIRRRKYNPATGQIE